LLAREEHRAYLVVMAVKAGATFHTTDGDRFGPKHFLGLHPLTLGNKSFKGGFRGSNRGKQACLRRVSVFGDGLEEKQANEGGEFGSKRCEFLKKGEAWPRKVDPCCRNF